MLNEWIVTWIQHQLPRAPLTLFDANIFYPAKNTLAFSEPLIVPALLGYPVRLLGGYFVFDSPDAALLVSLLASDNFRRGATEKKKLASKACAIRTRLPKFMGLETPSTPTAKYPRMQPD